MTIDEFSDEFDVLVDSYRRFKDYDRKEELDSLDFNEYEKSVFLTKAQEEIVNELYNGAVSKEPFEKTERLRRCLDALIETAYPVEVGKEEDVPEEDKEQKQYRSIIINDDDINGDNVQFFQLPDDVWFITFEVARFAGESFCKDERWTRVIPMRQDEWHKSSENPFKRPNRRRIIRLDNGSNVAELISDCPLREYKIRYLRRPKPIVLAEFPDGLTINGSTEVSTCELNDQIHRVILERAVQLAVSSMLMGKTSSKESKEDK